MATVYVKKLNKNDYASQAEYRDACAETLDAAIIKLRKKVANEGILKSYREKMYYISPGDKRRKAKKAGRRRTGTYLRSFHICRKVVSCRKKSFEKV